MVYDEIEANYALLLNNWIFKDTEITPIYWGVIQYTTVPWNIYLAEDIVFFWESSDQKDFVKFALQTFGQKITDVGTFGEKKR